MTRADFIKAYAARSGLSAEFAVIGLLDVGGKTMVAMPCACGEQDCEGWAMLTADGIDHHLAFNAPEPLRTVYCDAISQ